MDREHELMFVQPLVYADEEFNGFRDDPLHRQPRPPEFQSARCVEALPMVDLFSRALGRIRLEDYTQCFAA
eukprot:7022062-Heterocapsa_arctica.AAC.1